MIGIYKLMLVVWFCTILNRSLLGASGPELLVGIGASPSGLALPGMAQVIFYATMQFPVARLLRTIGPHRCLTIGLGLLLVAQLGMIWQASLWQIVLTRAVYGVGDSFMFVAIITIIATVKDRAAFSPAVQLMGVVGQLAQLAVYGLLGPALSLLGWMGPQVALGILNLIVLVVVGLRSRGESVDQPSRGEGSTHRRGPVATMLRAVSVAMLSHVTFMSATLSIGAVYLYAFVRDAQGIGLLGATAVMTVYIVSSFLVNAGIWKYLQRPGVVVFDLVQRLAWTFAIGIAVAGVLSMRWELLGSLLLAGLAGACGAATLLSFSLVPAPWTGTAVSVATVNIAGYLAGGLGLSVFAVWLAIDENGDGYHAAIISVGVLMVLGAALQRLVRGRLRRSDGDE